MSQSSLGLGEELNSMEIILIAHLEPAYLKFGGNSRGRSLFHRLQSLIYNSINIYCSAGSMYIAVGTSRGPKKQTLPYHYPTPQPKDVNPDKYTNDHKVEKIWEIKHMWSSKEKHNLSDWKRHSEKACTKKGPWGKKRNLRGRDWGREGILGTGETWAKSQSRKAQRIFRGQGGFNVFDI